MSQEGPFSYTRKAVEGAAEKLARNDFKDNPDENHYKEAFRMLRNAKQYDVEIFQRMVELFAESHDLRSLLGPDKFFLYDRAVRSIMDDFMETVNEKHQQMTNSEYEAFLEKGRINLKSKLEQDSVLEAVFEGKEDLLKQLTRQFDRELAIVKAVRGRT